MIRRAQTQVTPADVATEVPSEDEGFAEGRVLAALHKRRDRNPTLVRKKKAAVLAGTGKLACEVCGFDFQERYGELGAGFAECHHRTLLSELTSVGSTKLHDLAAVRANCHRMLHRSRPMLSVSSLKQRMAAL